MTLTKGQKWGIMGFLFLGVTSLGLYMYSQVRLLISSISTAFTKKPNVSKLNDLSLTNIGITLSYNVDNKSIISAEITNQKYVVTINDKPIVDINNNKLLILKSKGITKFELDVNFNPQELIKAGIKNITSILVASERKNFVVRIKGSFTYKAGVLLGENFPLDISFTLADLTS